MQCQVKLMSTWGPSGREKNTDHGHSKWDHRIQKKAEPSKRKNINIEQNFIPEATNDNIKQR